MNETKVTVEPEKQEILIEREFNAPVDLVFTVSTDPKYIPQWWGPAGFEMKVDKADVRSGGQWRFIHGGIGFHGVYHEVLPSKRVIQTFEWEGLPETGHVILETTRFEKVSEEKTKVTIQQVFQSVQDRDGMVASGQKKGMEESHGRLDALLEKLKAEK